MNSQVYGKLQCKTGSMLGKTFLAVIIVLGLLAPATYSAAQVDEEPISGNISFCIAIQNSLRQRSTDAATGGEVSLLQDFLIERGYMSGAPTGYYGTLTVAAVKRFQSANNINPVGYVGPVTRAAIKKVSCGTTAPTDPVTPTTPTNTSTTQGSGTGEVRLTQSIVGIKAPSGVAYGNVYAVKLSFSGGTNSRPIASWVLTSYCPENVDIDTVPGASCNSDFKMSTSRDNGNVFDKEFVVKNNSNTTQTVTWRLSGYDSNGRLIGVDKATLSVPVTGSGPMTWGGLKLITPNSGTFAPGDKVTVRWQADNLQMQNAVSSRISIMLFNRNVFAYDFGFTPNDGEEVITIPRTISYGSEYRLHVNVQELDANGRVLIETGDSNDYPITIKQGSVSTPTPTPSTTPSEALVSPLRQENASIAARGTIMPFVKFSITNAATPVAFSDVEVGLAGTATGNVFYKVLLREAATGLVIGEGIPNQYGSFLIPVRSAYTVNGTQNFEIVGIMRSDLSAYAGQTIGLNLNGVRYPTGKFSGSLPVVGSVHTVNQSLGLGKLYVANVTVNGMPAVVVQNGAVEKVKLISIAFQGQRVGGLVANLKGGVDVRCERTGNDSICSFGPNGMILDKAEKITLTGPTERSMRVVDAHDLRARGETYGFEIMPTFESIPTPYGDDGLTVPPPVTTTQDATITSIAYVSGTYDHVGAWNNFSGGLGEANRDGNDHYWQMTMNVPNKTISRITIKHNTPGQVWSTGYSRYLASNNEDLYGYNEHPYPIGVFYNAKQINNRYDQLLGAYNGQVTLQLFGEEEGSFRGGKVIVEFTDNTYVTKDIALPTETAPAPTITTTPSPTYSPTPTIYPPPSDRPSVITIEPYNRAEVGSTIKLYGTNLSKDNKFNNVIFKNIGTGRSYTTTGLSTWGTWTEIKLSTIIPAGTYAVSFINAEGKESINAVNYVLYTHTALPSPIFGATPTPTIAAKPPIPPTSVTVASVYAKGRANGEIESGKNLYIFGSNFGTTVSAIRVSAGLTPLQVISVDDTSIVAVAPTAEVGTYHEIEVAKKYGNVELVGTRVKTRIVAPIGAN